MKGKPRLFKESLKLVWKSAPGWATVNTAISVIQSVLPLAIVYLIKLLIDAITEAAAGGEGVLNKNLIMMIAAVVIVYLADEILTDFGNFVRKKQSVKLEVYMYGLLHAKAIKLDLINFEHPGYYDCLSRAISEALLAAQQHPEQHSVNVPRTFVAGADGRAPVHTALGRSPCPCGSKHPRDMAPASLC